jgi:tRNA (guanine37-N1)-methyltransferase
MRFDILTLFPELFSSPFRQSILKRAIDNGLVEIHIHDIRNYATDKHRVVDDYPYGGGEGMVMKVEPIQRALEAVKAIKKKDSTPPRTILLAPVGNTFNQGKAWELADLKNVILICGRYQGVDERVKELFVDEEISIGDYVLSGGEIPAMVIVDAVSRLVPGVLGCDRSAREDSFSMGLLEYPHYTRPETFEDHAVPEVLLSGDHKKIEEWRHKEALKRTFERKPALLENMSFSEEEKNFLKALKDKPCDNKKTSN